MKWKFLSTQNLWKFDNLSYTLLGWVHAGKYHCTIDLLFDWFGMGWMTTNNFCLYFRNRLIQTSQTGGQRYSDTSPFSVPWFMQGILFPVHETLNPDMGGAWSMIQINYPDIVQVYYIQDDAQGAGKSMIIFPNFTVGLGSIFRRECRKLWLECSTSSRLKL